MNPTIKDIAKDTGLSPATISKYLNAKSTSPESKAIIEASIQKLGYTPNKNAQMLRSKKSNAIAIIQPFNGDYFWGTVTSYVEEYLQLHNYMTVIVTPVPFHKDQTETYRQLLSIQAAGCIIINENIDQTNFFELLNAAQIPCVYLDQILKSCVLDSVTSDNFESAYQMTLSLIARGHRRIGVIGGPAESYTSSERVRGFQKACIENGILQEDQLISQNSYDAYSGLKSFRRMMELKHRPTAVFTLNYYFMLAAVQLLSEFQLRIPEDLSLVTFDDDEIFSAIQPPITVITQDLPLIAREAARLLLKRIHQDFSGFPETIYVKTSLVERGSIRTITPHDRSAFSRNF